MSERMIDACLVEQMLPPMIVHPSAHHVREFLLYEYETDTIRATAYSTGWGWHCEKSLVRTARVEYIEELFEQEMLGGQTTAVAEAMEGQGMKAQDVFPMVNVVAVHHHYEDTVDPSREEILAHTVKRRAMVVSHPLFESSVQKLQEEPVCRAFFLMHTADHSALDLLAKIAA